MSLMHRSGDFFYFADCICPTTVFLSLLRCVHCTVYHLLRKLWWASQSSYPSQSTSEHIDEHSSTSRRIRTNLSLKIHNDMDELRGKMSKSSRTWEDVVKYSVDFLPWEYIGSSWPSCNTRLVMLASCNSSATQPCESPGNASFRDLAFVDPVWHEFDSDYTTILLFAKRECFIRHQDPSNAVNLRSS